MLQTQWDRTAPLIVHACSSTTYPTSHYTIYKDYVYPYFSQNPAKYRFALGAYQKCAPALLPGGACCSAVPGSVSIHIGRAGSSVWTTVQERSM